MLETTFLPSIASNVQTQGPPGRRNSLPSVRIHSRATEDLTKLPSASFVRVSKQNERSDSSLQPIKSPSPIRKSMTSLRSALHQEDTHSLIARSAELSPRPSKDKAAMTQSLNFIPARYTKLRAQKSIHSKSGRDSYASAYQLWKRRSGIADGQQVFIVTGGYHDIRRVLLARGWAENTVHADSRFSPFYDFKFTLYVRDIDRSSLLKKHQIVNHYHNSFEITSKIGLISNLKNLRWFDVNMDSFYPRAFILSDKDDLDAFLDDFRNGAAQAVLKMYTQDQRNHDTDIVAKACAMCERKAFELRSLTDEDDEDGSTAVSTIRRKASKKTLKRDKPNTSTSSTTQAPQQQPTMSIPHDFNYTAYISTSFNESGFTEADWTAVINYQIALSNKREQALDPGNNPVDADMAINDTNNSSNELLARCNSVLYRLKEKCVQFDMDQGHNAWIVKPGRLSRGRGIQCFNDLWNLMTYVGREKQDFIAQKYIENPLIIQNRKFDIRQWVLVTDFNPLTVWFYDDCYLRFCTVNFSLNDIENKFVHLSNNSIQKHCEDFDKTDIEGNMWHSNKFIEYLRQHYNDAELWRRHIQNQMKRIVIWSLESAQERIESRKGSFELYGYDFMIDEKLNVWLIEINASPDLSYSTPITKELVQSLSEDLLKVVLDAKKPSSGDSETRDKHYCQPFGMSDDADNSVTDNPYSRFNTGKFECIYRSKRISDPPMSLLTKLVCQGKAMKIC